MPNIRHLRVVESVAHNASVSRAAEKLGLTQPAVSLAIAKLELMVGQPLFARTRSGCYLTSAGEVYLHRVERFLAQSDRAISDLHRGEDSHTYVRHVTSAQIRCLLAIAANSSFSQAARAIGVSTTAVQRTARELETTVRTPLFDSSKHGLKLNERGIDLARKLSLALCEIQAAEDDVRFLEGVESGKIVIGTMPMSSDYVIGATIAEWTSRLPDAHIHLITAPYNVLINDLRAGAIDLIFGVLRRPDWAVDLEEEMLFSDPYCIIGRAGHPLAAKPALDVADLLNYSWIVPREGSPRRKQFDSLFERADKSPRISMETSSLSAIRSLIANSDCLALINKHEVELDARLNRISVLHSPADFPSVPKGVTTRLNWLPTQIQQQFMNLMRKRANQAALPSDGSDTMPALDFVAGD